MLLEDQDRSRWDHDLIERGTALLERAGALQRPGPFQLQAAIAALHTQAASVEETDWVQIAALYGALLPSWSSPSAGSATPSPSAWPTDQTPGSPPSTDSVMTMPTPACCSPWPPPPRRRTDEATVAFDAAAELARHPLEVERLLRRAREISRRP